MADETAEVSSADAFAVSPARMVDCELRELREMCEVGSPFRLLAEQLEQIHCTPFRSSRLTEEELRAREERQRAQRRARYERARLAAEKAEGLLRSLLTPEQQEQLDRHGWFEITGSLGNRYRLETDDYQGNVYWIDEDGNALGSLCAHPRMASFTDDGSFAGQLPTLAAVAGQMLALQCDEHAFLREANPHGGRFPPAPDARASGR